MPNQTVKNGLIAIKIKLPQMNFFLEKQLMKFFMYLLVPLILQNLKKFFQQIQSYENAPFLGPKWFICPKQKFFLEH